MAGLFDNVRTVTGANGSIGVAGVQNQVVLYANIFIGLIAAISVFYIIKAGWEWMNGGEKNQAQQTMVNAVIGLIVALLAFIFVQFVVGGSTLIEGAL
jgi:hypothetical protein